MTPQVQPSLIQVPELYLIGALILFFAIWGWRHGLDAVILAGLFVLFGRMSVDTLAIPVGATINMFYGIFQLFATGKFSGGNLFAVIGGDPNVVAPLIVPAKILSSAAASAAPESTAAAFEVGRLSEGTLSPVMGD